MTPHEIELATALGQCAAWTGGRFVADISYAAKTNPERDITERQRYYMEILAWRYRRQLPSHLVPESKPVALPPKRREPKAKKAKPPDLFSTAYGQTVVRCSDS